MAYLAQLLIGLCTGGVAAWLTAQFALRRFYSEKWWEKRATAFIVLTDAVYQVQLAQEYWVLLDESRREGPEEYPNFKELDGPEKAELMEKEKLAMEVITKFSQVGPLQITEKASKLLISYLKDVQKAQYDVDFLGWETDEAQAHCLELVRTLLKDLIKESSESLKAK
ncbi:hypothetical protein GE191_12040 [Serratia fonticola]|uniref:hypothetical protein n=1 Tax=Serratia fonticola TaxID=47917 RepID=UPI001377CD9E|nr:hypothetical protein [Serratia fonticola]NBJ34412.1 hypothetical protein [Serratia fonticola]